MHNNIRSRRPTPYHVLTNKTGVHDHAIKWGKRLQYGLYGKIEPLRCLGKLGALLADGGGGKLKKSIIGKEDIITRKGHNILLC